MAKKSSLKEFGPILKYKFLQFEAEGSRIIETTYVFSIDDNGNQVDNCAQFYVENAARIFKQKLQAKLDTGAIKMIAEASA